MFICREMEKGGNALILAWLTTTLSLAWRSMTSNGWMITVGLGTQSNIIFWLKKKRRKRLYLSLSDQQTVSDTFSGIWSSFAENSQFMEERERMIGHFALKCSCLISTTCQMVVNCINHVPNSHSSLTFKGNYSEHSLPEVLFHPLTVCQNIPTFILFWMQWHRQAFYCVDSNLNVVHWESYLFLVVITLDQPGDSCLWGARNTL